MPLLKSFNATKKKNLLVPGPYHTYDLGLLDPVLGSPQQVCKVTSQIHGKIIAVFHGL